MEVVKWTLQEFLYYIQESNMSRPVNISRPRWNAMLKQAILRGWIKNGSS